ncbi:MAG: acetyl-CoA carboxylase biotin carboxyl carrier protein subunit [Blastocatellia bacterium]
MRYEAEIDGLPVSVELDERDGRVSAKIGERAYDLEIARPEENVYLIFDKDQVYEARAWSEATNSEATNATGIQLRDRIFTVNIIDRKHRRMAADHTSEGRQQLIAPMPGKVVRVLLKLNDEVAAGQGVVVVEAMKMQNEIKSPKAGRVIEIRVTEGATVTANQVLAIVE